LNKQLIARLIDKLTV